MKLKHLLIEAGYWTWDRIYRVWLFAKRRPFLRCPICEGKGGGMCGYYEPEWSECECYDHWRELEDHGCPWFVGRLPLRQWLRAKVGVRLGTGANGITRIRTLLKCRIGWHKFRNMAPDHDGKPWMLCVHCYADKDRPGGDD